MVAIKKFLKKSITYMLIGSLVVTSLTSFYSQAVFAEEETTKASGSSDNPYKGNPDNVIDLMKNSWYYTVTQLGFFVNDMCTFDLSSIGVGACQNKMDYEEWLSGHNMTVDDVVDSYDASTGTVNLSIEYVTNVYNDVLDAVQEDEGWYWSSGKSGMGYLSGMQVDVYRALKEKALNSKAYFILPVIGIRDGTIYKNKLYILFIYDNYYLSIPNSIGTAQSLDKIYYYGNSNFLSVRDSKDKNNLERLYSDNYSGFIFSTSGIDNLLGGYKIYGTDLPYQVKGYSGLRPYYGEVNSDDCRKDIIEATLYGPKQKVFISLACLNSHLNGSEVLIQSVNENLSSISIKLDDLNRDWLKVNNEIKDLIDDYMQDFQDYTDKQDKIDAAISSTLTTMNENLAAGKEDLIGAIKESAAVQQLWLERIYNKEVEIYTKYLEENEQTQAVLVGIANQMKEYFDASLKNQGNYLTYEQFQEYAQQIIDAINNSSGGSSSSETGDSTVDMTIVDEYIKKLYEKETDLYNKLNEISGKLDTINNNLTKYLWNTDKSIPFLAEISNLIKDGFEKCTTPLSGIADKLDDLISLGKKILNKLSVQNLIDTIDRTKSDDEEENASLLDLVTCVLYAVLILGSLCDLFLKMLEYVILMFQIPATPALFNEDILLGWNYAASIKIPNTDFGILDFLRLLIYITMIFGVVKIIRRAIHNGSIDVI